MNYIVESPTHTKKESPRKVCSQMSTSRDIQVYEGDHVLAEYNTFLGAFNLSGLKPAAAGTVTIALSFHFNHPNQLDVMAAEISSGDCFIKGLDSKVSTHADFGASNITKANNNKQRQASTYTLLACIQLVFSA